MPFKLFKLKKVRTCEGCRAYIHRCCKSAPECYLGEKIKEEGDWLEGKAIVKPESGTCYKPLTDNDLIFIKETFYT